MSENEFEFEICGDKYIAIKSEDSCAGCAFEFQPIRCIQSPECSHQKRGDGLGVIWVEKC